ncbi:odorant receptor 4 isoform X3 [Galleria mellonella]|uniref:Odorant receptor n=1 Tax=Galleria mellonella TaxID=7137 RepID=A0A5C0E4M9_GALME|nr:odorant receptor 4 isoform X3 [Galleria mellonella]QEI46835.1 odorant receptor 19 [Galleria mellonella]
MTKSSFETSLKLTKLIFVFAGIQIARKKNNRFVQKLLFCVFYFHFSFLYSNIIGQSWGVFDAIVMGKSFLEISFSIPCIGISVLSTVKVVFLFYHQDLLINIVNKLRSIHPEADDEDMDEIQTKIVKDAVKLLNLVVMMLVYITVSVTIAFPIVSIVAMVNNYNHTGEFKVVFPYIVTYFFDPFTRERWPFVYLYHVWSTVIVAAYVFGSDTLFYALCTYIQMHFKILRHRFENMVKDSTEETRAQLVKNIVRHQELIELVNQVEILYSKSTLFNIVTSSVLICLSGFNITTLKDTSVIILFGTFLYMSLSQISLLCYFGDLLMNSSIQLTGGIYNSLWYETDQEIKKCILLIIIRTQKPCKLTAAKFADLNLSAFTTILSRSWSYFALLRTMYKE